MTMISRLAAAILGGALLLPSTVQAGVPVPERSIEKAEAVVQVRRGGGHFSGGGRSYGYRHYGYRPVYRRPAIYFAAPVVAYGGHCAYLRHKAHATGSPYWWRRYRYEC